MPAGETTPQLCFFVCVFSVHVSFSIFNLTSVEQEWGAKQRAPTAGGRAGAQGEEVTKFNSGNIPKRLIIVWSIHAYMTIFFEDWRVKNGGKVSTGHISQF